MVNLCGETVRAEDVRLFKARFADHCLLGVSFGSTEAAGAATRILMDKLAEPGDGPVPSGYAVDGIEILIVDENGRRLGPGKVGEIVLRGHYLSPGYWRQPELTRAAFMADPDGSGARMYHTGDLGSLASDGCLTHWGRKDFQVKVRGHRVELSEVEAALLRSPGIREAVAIAADGASGSRRIVAYVVPAESPVPTVSCIRTALAAALPGYMIPSSFVFLDALPLTPGGKVDRQRLPPSGHDRPQLDNECRAPRTGTQARLARIWEKILDVRPVGITDNFFELGGDSLAIATVCAAIEGEFGRTFPPTDLLKAPTVQGLAGLLEEAPVGAEEASVLAFRTTGIRPPLFCVDMGNAGIFAHLARRLGPDQPCYGLHSFGYSERVITIESLAAYFVRRARAIQPEGPYYLCGMCGGAVAAYEMAQQLLAAGQSVAWLALFDAFIPRRSVLPRALQRTIRRWQGHSDRLAQRRADESRSTALVDRQLSLLKRYEHENRKVTGRAMALYRPKPYPGRLHLFLAEKTITEARGSRLAWADLARDGAETLTVPGMHQKMLLEPDVAVLTSHVRRCLEEAR
jgi:thioesterase domain-containing protein/acyl carrier protein